MKGFLAFFAACALVATLSVIPAEHARWVALALLGAVYVVSALPRRRVGR